MNIEHMTNELLGEELYFYQFESKLRAYVLPKRGFSKQYAIFATNYGSIDNIFKPPEESEYVSVPEGIAHFLEHKLFEQKDENAFDKFAKLGSSPNAYTNYNTTAYLFSSTDRFLDNLDILLDFVQNPYLTDENVEKEKGIIEQEIRMYEDNPNTRVFNNLMKCLYINNPINKDIAGTVESINKVNKETLNKCYDTFYHPSNMVIFITGDVDFKEVFNLISSKVDKPYKGEIKRKEFDEPEEIKQSYIESRLPISIPVFSIGFKDSQVGLSNKDLLKRIVLSNIIIDSIFGRSSSFFNKLYEQGLINDNFDVQFIGEKRYCFTLISGESENPEQVRQKIVEEINKYINEGIDIDTFNRIKKMNIGRFIRHFNNIENISHTFINLIFSDIMIFDYIDMLNSIDFNDIPQRFNEMFDTTKMAISVVNKA